MAFEFLSDFRNRWFQGSMLRYDPYLFGAVSRDIRIYRIVAVCLCENQPRMATIDKTNNKLKKTKPWIQTAVELVKLEAQ